MWHRGAHSGLSVKEDTRLTTGRSLTVHTGSTTQDPSAWAQADLLKQFLVDEELLLRVVRALSIAHIRYLQREGTGARSTEAGHDDVELAPEPKSYRSSLFELEGEKTEQTAASLATIWKITEDEAKNRIQLLIEIGFFQERGGRDHWTYWVPFLYRDALSMSQGAADEV